MEGVHYFVRGLFRGIPETRNITEQREELESHINDRIADSIAAGLSETEAFTKAVESLGNLAELIDTMTGERKKIYVKKMEWFQMAGDALYGTAYMVAVGIWFYHNGFGLSAVYVAIPGWLGFAVPALIKFIEYRKNPKKTAVVPIDISDEVRSSLLGWLGISIACWIVNILLLGSNTFLSVIWAWMPTLGLLTWPMQTMYCAWLLKNSASLVPGQVEAE